MRKEFIKKNLYILGIGLVIFSVSVSLIDAEFDIFTAMRDYLGHYLDFFIADFNATNVLTIVGPILILIGLFIDINDEKDNVKIIIKKYKILRALGTLPFIGVIIYVIICMYESGAEMHMYFEGIKFISYLIWPLYILGLVMISFSTIRLKKYKRK